MLKFKCETLILPNINLKKIENDYKNGTFVNYVIPKLNYVKKFRSLVTTIANSPDADVYMLKSKLHNGSIIATTNCASFNKNVNDGAQKYRCRSCHRDFDIIGDGFSTANDYDDNYNIVTSRNYGNFCSDQCKCYFLIDKTSKLKKSIDNDWSYYLTILKSEHFAKFGTSLLPSNDPYLLQINGGSLTDEEWEDKRYTYIATDNKICIPLKETHQRFMFQS